MRKHIKVIALLFLAVILVACGQNNQQETTQDNTETSAAQEGGTVEIIIQVDGKEVDKKEVPFKEGQNQLEILKENFNVVDKEGWVTAINGYEDSHQPVKDYWMFTVDGKLSGVNANLHELADGEVIIWNLATEHE